MVRGVEAAAGPAPGAEAKDGHSLACSLVASSPKLTAHDCLAASECSCCVAVRSVEDGRRLPCRRLCHRDEDEVAVGSARVGSPYNMILAIGKSRAVYYLSLTPD